MRLWRIEVPGFPTSIREAETRSKARYATWRVLHDLGYDYEFGDIRVTALPEASS